MNTRHYTYRVTWSPEDGEHVGLCLEFPSLSWLSKDLEGALKGISDLVKDVVSDMEARGEELPEALSERAYSGKFQIRIPPDRHRSLALRAAEQGVSLNRYVSDRLCA